MLQTSWGIFDTKTIYVSSDWDYSYLILLSLYSAGHGQWAASGGGGGGGGG